MRPRVPLPEAGARGLVVCGVVRRGGVRRRTEAAEARGRSGRGPAGAAAGGLRRGRAGRSGTAAQSARLTWAMTHPSAHQGQGGVVAAHSVSVPRCNRGAGPGSGRAAPPPGWRSSPCSETWPVTRTRLECGHVPSPAQTGMLQRRGFGLFLRMQDAAFQHDTVSSVGPSQQHLLASPASTCHLRIEPQRILPQRCTTHIKMKARRPGQPASHDCRQHRASASRAASKPAARRRCGTHCDQLAERDNRKMLASNR